MQKGYKHAFHLLSYAKMHIHSRLPHKRPKLTKKPETFLRLHNRYTAGEPENLLQSAGRKNLPADPQPLESNPSPFNNMDPKTICKKGTYSYLIYFHFQDITLIFSTASKISKCLFSKIRVFLVFQRIYANHSWLSILKTLIITTFKVIWFIWLAVICWDLRIQFFTLKVYAY